MGADAHGTAALGHRQSHGQRLFPARQMNGMLPHPGAGQNVLAAGQAGGGTGARVGKDLLGRACPEHLAAVHHDHLPAQAVGLVPVVGHQQGRARKPGQQAAHFPFYFLAQVAVQRTERLVQHQDAGFGRQNAGQGGTLLLPARKRAGQALGQFLQPHGPQCLGTGGPAGGRVLFLFQGAEDILFHGHVGEQGVVLEQQTHIALLGRQVDALGAVEQHPSIQHDAPFVRPDDACNTAQGHAFAAAGCAQKGGGSVPCRERSVEGKAIKPLGHIYFQAHVRFPPCFCLRSSRLTASSTTAEITISTSTHCMAPASSLVRQSW